MEDLEKWFKANAYPQFILAYANGKGENQILKNEGDGAISDIEEAWEMLRDMIEAQVRSGRAILEVKVFPKGGKYHPLRTQIDMSAGGNPYLPASVAGIGNLPNVGISEAKLAEALAVEREKWEMERRIEDLEARINAPSNWMERALQIIGENPPLATMVQTVISGVMKMPGVASVMNGTPAAATGTQAPADDEEMENTDPNVVFSTNIYQAAQTLGVSPEIMAVKLNRLVQQNPELAYTMLHQQPE